MAAIISNGLSIIIRLPDGREYIIPDSMMQSLVMPCGTMEDYVQVDMSFVAPAVLASVFEQKAIEPPLQSLGSGNGRFLTDGNANYDY